MTDDPEQIARGLTKAQRKIVVDSEPGAFGRDDEACGAELRTGPSVVAARVLERKGLGHVEDHAPFWPRFMFFGNAKSLAVREIILREEGR